MKSVRMIFRPIVVSPDPLVKSFKEILWLKLNESWYFRTYEYVMPDCFDI